MIGKLIDHLSAVPAGLLDDQLARLGIPLAELLHAAAEGFVTKAVVLTRRVQLSGPLFDSTRDAPHRARAIEGALRCRWEGVPKQSFRMWHLTGHAPPNGRLEHDLNLAEVYTHTRLLHPELTWLSERNWTKVFGARNHEVPDALLIDPRGSPVAFVDFAGSYRSDRTQALFSYAASQGIALQLW